MRTKTPKFVRCKNLGCIREQCTDIDCYGPCRPVRQWARWALTNERGGIALGRTKRELKGWGSLWAGESICRVVVLDLDEKGGAK